MTKFYFLLLVRLINIPYDADIDFRIGRVVYTVKKISDTWYTIKSNNSWFVFINGNFGIVRFDEDDDSILYDTNILDMFMALSKGK